MLELELVLVDKHMGGLVPELVLLGLGLELVAELVPELDKHMGLVLELVTELVLVEGSHMVVLVPEDIFH